jgi:hypothetical protein
LSAAHSFFQQDHIFAKVSSGRSVQALAWPLLLVCPWRTIIETYLLDWLIAIG